MNYETIDLTVQDRVATITLRRPDRLNAFTLRMGRELIAAFDRTDADDSVRAVIVTGSGRAFCAGMELDPAHSDAAGNLFGLAPGEDVESHPEKIRDSGGTVTLRIFESRKPVIAAINGPAVGIGVTMTLAMDYRLAVRGSKLGFVFARRGIVTEACSSWFLPRIVGVPRALDWILSGRVFPSEEALEGGLVRSLHAPEELLPAARKIAAEIAENSSAVSVALCRQLVWRMSGAPHPMLAHRADSRAMYHASIGPDAAEGIASFLEKRAPRFQGSASRDLPDTTGWWEDPPFR